ncbi:zinc finger protein 391-like isoform X2 [Girardinichthys multiradiatus]|uniref:zinc finger protein 391-like isoform X2 n=1 Tax=Girardinichthys multiradiatus TaxID=208333 RepID=UPI001FAE5F5F|nr:zinc finger protein 391-like isoform X2 [Girardinichthys multiradiatus]
MDPSEPLSQHKINMNTILPPPLLPAELPQKQQLWNQERICCLAQKDPEPSRAKEKHEIEQTKEEQKEPELLLIKEEPEEPELMLVIEEPDEPEPQQIKQEPGEPEPQQIKQEPEECSISQEQLVLKQETETLMVFRSKSRFTEIFGGSGDIIIQFEEEVDGHRRLLEINWTPVIKLHRLELPQLLVYKDKEVLTGQQLCNQEDPEPPQIKEELREDTDAVLVTVAYDDTDLGEPEPDTDPSDDEIQDRVGRKDSAGAQSSELRLKKHYQRDRGDPVTVPQSWCDHDGFGETSEKTCRSLLISPWRNTTFSKPSTDGSCGPELSTPSATRILSHIHEDRSCHSNRWGADMFLYEMTDDQQSHRVEKPYSCSLCDKRFGYSSHLVSHIRTHTGEKPYCCEDCGKCFSRRETLVRHAAMHTEMKPYSCKQCGKSFSRTETLRQHVRTHTGEKPFSCSECGKCFSLRGNLMTHKRTHTGEKLHSCSTCGKRFGNRSHLLSHMRTHTGEKPYSCKLCGKSFSQSGSLMKHKRTHTGEKPYSCKECGKRFSESGILRKHERTHKSQGGVSVRGVPL